MFTGKRNGWLEYGSSTHFTPCPKPDHHACLDKFETDGNIQFQPWNIDLPGMQNSV